MATYVEKVAAFGGSSTLGIGVENGVGWVQMLHDRYAELNADLGVARRPRIFYELGVFAARAADLAESVSTETDRRFWIPGEENYDKGKRLSVVSIGVNDSWLRAKDGTYVTPMDEFVRSIESIAASLAVRSRILTLGLLPCDESKCGNFWNIPTPPQREARQKYETEALRVFGEAGATTVPLASEAYDSTEYMNNLSEDGVHGGVQSERWIYRKVLPYFDELVSMSAQEKNQV